MVSRGQLLSLFSCLSTATAGSAMAQPNPGDKGLEVRTQKVLAACLEKGFCAEHLEVGLESAKASTRYMRGWAVRDARISAPDAPAELIADIQRRMAMTKSIDHLTIDIEVESATPREAVVFAHQNFSRVLRMPGGAERRRITAVTHREHWDKSSGQWKLKSFTEQNQTARWDDQPPQPKP